jgi:Zn-dependent peptidase ImmA (M78 family)
MLGRRTAANVIARHGTNDLKAIARAEGVRVLTRHPWPARFDEVMAGRLILIPRDLPTSQRRAVIAHALGHHFLHDGNQVWLHGLDRVWNARQERQADEFAAWLCIPESDEPRIAGLPLPDLARRYRVTLDLAALRRKDTLAGGAPSSSPLEGEDLGADAVGPKR